MPDARYQGAYAESYIRSLALASGLNVLRAEVDDDGVDAMIRYSGDVGPIASPGVDVQVKSWSTPRKTGDFWNFNGLNEQQFNKLAGGNYQMPRFLIVLIIPAERMRIAEITTEGMLLRHRAYFISVEQEPRITHPSTSRRRRIFIPKDNVLTSQALRRMIHSDLAVQEAYSD